MGFNSQQRARLGGIDEVKNAFGVRCLWLALAFAGVFWLGQHFARPAVAYTGIAAGVLFLALSVLAAFDRGMPGIVGGVRRVIAGYGYGSLVAVVCLAAICAPLPWDAMHKAVGAIVFLMVSNALLIFICRPDDNASPELLEQYNKAIDRPVTACVGAIVAFVSLTLACIGPLHHPLFAQVFGGLTSVPALALTLEVVHQRREKARREQEERAAEERRKEREREDKKQMERWEREEQERAREREQKALVLAEQREAQARQEMETMLVQARQTGAKLRIRKEINGALVDLIYDPNEEARQVREQEKKARAEERHELLVSREEERETREQERHEMVLAREEQRQEDAEARRKREEEERQRREYQRQLEINKW